MYGVVITVHLVVCVLLVIAVLLQSGKGSDIGAVFGGAGSQALFGSAGPADFLNKATRVLAGVFILTSLTLGYFMIERPSKSIMKTKSATSAPILPAPAKTDPSPVKSAPAAPAAQPATPAK